MPARMLGCDLQVSALGLGCMGLSTNYGTPVDRDAGIALIVAITEYWQHVVLDDSTCPVAGCGHHDRVLHDRFL